MTSDKEDKEICCLVSYLFRDIHTSGANEIITWRVPVHWKFVTVREPRRLSFFLKVCNQKMSGIKQICKEQSKFSNAAIKKITHRKCSMLLNKQTIKGNRAFLYADPDACRLLYDHT